MAYSRQKDIRLHENSLIANENERLGIFKQSEVVTCLSHLSIVLGKDLSMATNLSNDNMLYAVQLVIRTTSSPDITATTDAVNTPCDITKSS